MGNLETTFSIGVASVFEVLRSVRIRGAVSGLCNESNETQRGVAWSPVAVYEACVFIW